MNLDELCNGMPGLTQSLGEVFRDAASVCLAHNRHVSDTELTVEGSLNDHAYSVKWPTPTKQVTAAFGDLSEAVEWGACGVAALLMFHLTELVVVERSAKGSGFDFWLGEPDDEPLFQEKTRLEVSGILNGSSTAVRERVKRKVEQMRDGGVPGKGYAVVVHFAPPNAVIAAP